MAVLCISARDYEPEADVAVPHSRNRDPGGPPPHLVHPSAAMGSALRLLVSLAVAVIVFEGGLSLNFRDLRASSEGALRLTAVARAAYQDRPSRRALRGRTRLSQGSQAA